MTKREAKRVVLRWLAEHLERQADFGAVDYRQRRAMLELAKEFARRGHTPKPEPDPRQSDLVEFINNLYAQRGWGGE